MSKSKFYDCKFFTAFLFLVLLGPLQLAAQEFAFKNVAVISFEPTQITYGQTVLVSDGKITKIGPSSKLKISDSHQVIDGRGNFLIPGMMDSHAHLPGPQGLDMDTADYLLLQLVHGVTSLRVSRYEPEFMDLRKKIEEEKWVSPRLFLPAPAISRNSDPISDPNESFKGYKSQGYDHIKYLSGLTAVEHEACARAAEKAGLPFFGHLLSHLDLESAIDYRQKGIEHLHGFTVLQEAGKIDEMKRLIAKSAARKIFHCPTASWYNGYTLNFEDPEKEFASRPGLEYLPVDLKDSWKQWLSQRKNERIDGDKKVRDKVLPHFVESGVPMLVSPGDGYYFVPGLAMLLEMRVFSRAGFSNDEILKAATFNGADFYDQTDTFGNIRTGLRSDLALLANNPLEDLQHIHAIEGVMLGNRWFDKQELRRLLDGLKNKHRRENINRSGK